MCSYNTNLPFPHEGNCAGSRSSDRIPCNCDTCPFDLRCADGEHGNHEASTTWSKIETVLCFGIHTHAAEEAHCGDITLAVWLAIIAAVLYEFVLIPVHAARESYAHRAPYCTSLKHAWLHQCWCCAKRDRPQSGEDGTCIFCARVDF